MLRMPEELRSLLSRPLGILFKDSTLWTSYKHVLRDRNVITVGDIVTRDYIKYMKEPPPLAVVDWKTKRVIGREQDIPELKKEFIHVLTAVNPPAHINMLVLRTLLQETALYFPDEPTLIEVEGEEDLLVLPLALTHAHGSRVVILYGQPDKGVVLMSSLASGMPRIESILQVFQTNTITVSIGNVSNKEKSFLNQH